MRPLYTEEDCLKCHWQQGHKIGDIRGGVSISIPFGPFQALQRQSYVAHSISFVTLWILGLAGISLAGKSLNRHIHERRKTEEQYASIIDNSLTGIYIIQGDRIVFANQQFADLYGYSLEEVVGMDALEFVHPEDRSFVKNQREKRFAGVCAPYAYEARSIRKTGECIWVQRRVSVIDYQGKPAILGNLLNISPLKEAEAAMKASGEALKKKNRELEAFTSVAAHDLREPLRKVEAFGNLLASKCGPGLDDESRDYLQRMQNAAGRMTALIESLLDYSCGSKKIQPFKTIDLNIAVTSAMSNLEVLLAETGGVVEIGDLPTVAADELQMIQLFQNLIGNSLKFRQTDKTPKIKISSRPAGSPGPGETTMAWEILVEDNGIGFEEKFSDIIFAPFERLHGKSDYEGSGIGLAICGKIVARHGGTLTARSTPRKGSTFIVMLPVGQNTPHPSGDPGSDS
jgi:PAS domain S-box-containing protein